MEDVIRDLLRRLARPHASGDEVVERAALLAEGSEFPAIMAWITDHAGIAQTDARRAPAQGLHGSRMSSARSSEPPKPLRYVIPAGALA